MITVQEARDRAALAKEFDPNFCLLLDSVSHLIEVASAKGKNARVFTRWELPHPALIQLHKYLERTDFRSNLAVDKNSITVEW